MLLSSEDEARDFVRELCSTGAFDKLERFAAMLRAANSGQNLIAASTLDTLWLRHIADSLQLLNYVPRETSEWLDLGSGPGFPGLMIAIAEPERKLCLVESRSLRIQWLNHVIRHLGLINCRVFGSDLRRLDRFDADVISARAFAPLPRLVDISARFSTNTTSWVLPKGRSAAQDIAMLPESLRPRFHVKPSITSAEAGIVVGHGDMKVRA